MPLCNAKRFSMQAASPGSGLRTLLPLLVLSTGRRAPDRACAEETG